MSVAAAMPGFSSQVVMPTPGSSDQLKRNVGNVVEPLVDGDYNILVELEDLAGNVSSLSEPLAITIDASDPQRPAPEEVEYYLCGPPVMTRAVMTMLDDLGVDRDNILLDDFGA